MGDELEDYIDASDLDFIRCIRRIELRSQIVATSSDDSVRMTRRLRHLEEKGYLDGQGRYTYRLTAQGEKLATSTALERAWLFIDRRIGGPLVAIAVAAAGALLVEAAKRLIGWN